MKSKYLPTTILAICLLLLPLQSALCEVTADPMGFAVWVEAEDTLETELTLSNTGEEDVAFRLRYSDVDREDERRRGPRRDDPGDILGELELEHPGALGISRDFETDAMWVSHTIVDENGAVQDGFFTCYEVVGDEVEVLEDIHPGAPPLGGCYYDGIMYSTSWMNMWVARYDMDGNNIGSIDFNGYVMACAVDPERAYLFVIIYEQVVINVLDINDDFEQVGVIENVLEHGNDADFRGRMYWAPEHEDGHLWLSYEWQAYQLNIDDDWNWEIVQEAFDVETDVRSFGIGHDGIDLWIGNMNSAIVTITDDGIAEPNWFMADPLQGEIAANEETTIGVMITPGEIEEGIYEILVRITLTEVENDRDDLEQTSIEFAAVMSYNTPVAQLSGTVTDAADDEAVEGANVEMDYYAISRITDGEGSYETTNLPLGDYEYTFTMQDYLPAVEEISLDEEGEFELNVELFHSECNPSMEEIVMELEPDMSQEVDFQVSNDGNGPLTYTLERRLLGGADADPWDIRGEANVEQIVEDDMLNGIVFADGRFFVTGGNNGDDVNKIYVLNPEGELIEQFDQFAESRYGMRDLAWDGELIWGADEGVLFSFTTEGELMSTIESEADIDCRSIAWDTEHELLWVADISSEIFGINRDGELVETFERPEELRIYGLAYWTDDPDGYPLYVFGRGEETDLDVKKVNMENGDIMLVRAINIEGSGRPGGIQISNEFDICSWVFIGLVQNPDRLAVWQLASYRDWFLVEPVEGVIQGNESEDFVLTFNTANLPPNNTLEGELVFTHDGVGGETVVNVRLEVVEGQVHTTQDIHMEIGWNLVSAHLQPDDEENIRGLMAALVEEELLIIMKNSDGEFYRPDYDYNNIPGWYVDEGYQMLVSGDCVLTLEGMSVLSDRAISLEQGWQIVSYYPRSSIDARVALSGIVDHLIIAKDGRGNFYLPDWDFSNMGDLIEGQGYYLNVDEDIELVYQIGEEANALSGIARQLSVYDASGCLPVHAVTGENMSLLVFTEAPTPLCGGGIEGGGAVGVYAGDQLVGSGVLQDGVCGLAIWGDDPTTAVIDGAREGETLEIELFDGNNPLPVQYNVLCGETVYHKNEFAVIQLTTAAEIPVEFGIIAAYPNPFNNQVLIKYGLTRQDKVNLAVYDLEGRQVAMLVNGQRQTGIHTALFNAAGLTSGLYLISLETPELTSLRKVILVK